MSIIYVDSSALVKRYLHESGSDDVIRLIERSQIIGSVILTRVELASAFQKSVRMGWAEQAIALQSWQDFLRHWSASFAELQVSDLVVEKASTLAWTYGLRGYDSIHLAAALAWQDALDLPVLLATFDRNLWQASQKAGLEAWPPGFVS